MLETLPVRADVLVIGLGAGLYLLDLSVRIYGNEVVFSGVGTIWTALTPRNGFFFARRYWLFPGAIDPGRSSFVTRWPPGTDDSNAMALGERTRQAHAALRVPRFLCRLLLPEIFLVLPLVYLLRTNDLQVLIVLLVVYLQIVVAVGWMFAARRRTGLPASRCLFWAFEALVCIPYAINLNRKIGAYLLEDCSRDTLHAAETLLPATVQNMFRDELMSRVRAHRDLEPPDSRRAETLKAFEDKLRRSL